ncbi:CU044_5270 family protein [Nonomuraea indica]|uniref:CU044_5270 family protein n=1 Tax=Nonomuraea indica TaxID=1581193 RepID=A0ABW8A7I0_9ACTN
MNPIDDVRAARPAHLGDTEVDQRTRQAELAYAMSQGAPAPRRRSLRPVWGLSLAGAAAAVTAVAVFGAGAGGGAGGGTTPAVRSATGTAAPMALSAQQVLLMAATKAEGRPSSSGTYWHTESVQRTLTRAVAGYLVVEEGRIQSWVSATGQWSRSQPLGAQPATDADRARWEAAGSPAQIEVEVPGKRTRTLTTEPGKPHSGHHAGKEIFWLGRNVTMADLKRLPEDETALKRWLLRHYQGHGTESGAPMGRDAWLFQTTAGLITDMPVSAKVRAAAFRMLAGLPTVTASAGVTDARGRSGTAVAIETESLAPDGHAAGKGTLQDRLIIDEQTGQALARESVVVEPGGLQKDFEPGTVWNSVTLVKAAWTDSREN